MSWIKNIFKGGAVKSIEKIASEWIQTDMEKAEAQTLMLKVMDPNGMMRRNISRRTLQLYSFYLITMTLLIFLEFFGFGVDIGADGATNIESASKKLTDLFIPVSSMTGVIVGGSFGVNLTNSLKDK